MFQITQYLSAIESQVQKITSLEEILNIIKTGDENLPLVQAARKYGKGSKQYDNIKKKMLPTFRFNFLFEGTAANKNIIGPTGLIYIDADGLDEVPESNYIFAKWKSLSDTGFGLLVKVDNLTKVNYAQVYDQVSDFLRINTDIGARKATQQTVQSFDPELYHNPKALVFHYTENKIALRAPISEKREGSIGTHSALTDWNDCPIRFNNLGDYFVDNDESYLVFNNEKIRICSPFIPLRIEEGKRNSTMFFLMSQYALLNRGAGRPFLTSISETVNCKMYPKLSLQEVSKIIESVLKKREEGSLEMFYNDERRIIFNPSLQITFKEKMQIVNLELGHLKTMQSIETIRLAIDNWDHHVDGKITQTNVALKSGRHRTTVQRHWSCFKDIAESLNAEHKKSMIVHSATEKLNPILHLLPSKDIINWELIEDRLVYKVA